MTDEQAEFRDLVPLLAPDETISNAEFSQMVTELEEWDLRIKWLSPRVDTSQADDVE